MNLRTCRYCHQNLPADAFGRKADNPDGLSFMCRTCKSAQNKNYSSANAKAISAINKKRHKANLDRRSVAFMEAHGNQCAMCNKTFQWLHYDLDHIDPSKKTKNPAQMIQHASDATWEAEAANLRLLCGRCHRKHTKSFTPNLNPNKGRRFIDAIKMESGCARCGWAGWAEALDFDHVPSRGPKLFNIGRCSTKSVQALAEEIAKCDILCVHCHRDKTHGPEGSKEPPGTTA